MTKIELIKRLYKSYTRRYIKNIFVAVFFTILLAGSTSGVAYLLDPAIKQLFIEQEQSLIYIIPGLIVLAFIVKGSSLYIAKVIKSVYEWVFHKRVFKTKAKHIWVK